MRCFYSPDFELREVSGNPLDGEISRLSQEMMLARGILRPEEIIEVDMVEDHLLGSVHDRDYLGRIYLGQLGAREKIRLGMRLDTPIRGLYRRCATEAEATRLACHAALEEGVAACLGGGRMHAFRSHGETFSVFNDIALAVRDIQQTRPSLRVMVINTDALAGQGMNSLLEHTPNVYVYSIHTGIAPQASTASQMMNIEVPRYLEGDLYLKVLFNSLAQALERFVPDLVVWISGADQLRGDKLGGMWLTHGDLRRRDEVLLGALVRNRIPVAILYGGAYHPDRQHAAEAYCQTLAVAKSLQAPIR